MSTTGPNFPVSFPSWVPAPAASGGTYVNGIQIVYSPWDFSLLLSRAVPTEFHPEAPAEGQVRFRVEAVPQFVETLVMSPQHAKAMLKALEDNIKAYEKDHGEIPLIDVSSAPRGSETAAGGESGVDGK
jgi:hypothetical protein